MYYTPPTCIRYAYAHSLTGARVLTPYKEIGCGAIVMAGMLILTSPHPGLDDGAAPDSSALGWRAGGGFTPEDARLTRIVFKIVTR